jgi:hypothetical protein
LDLWSLPLAFSLGDLLSTKVLALVLWIGVAVLSLAMVVLTLTRFGQAKPLTKCITLSVFAHVLLGGYAHVTHLFIDKPVIPAEQTLEFQLVDDQPASNDPAESQSLESQPWNHFPSQESITPDADPLARQQVNATSVSTPDFDSQPTEREDWSPQNLASDVEIEQVAKADITPAEAPLRAPRPTNTAVAAAPIEIPSPQASQTKPIENADTQTASEEPQLARRNTDTPSPAPQQSDPILPPGAENELAAESESRLNELADIALKTATADAAAALENNVTAAQNQDRGSREEPGSGQTQAAALPTSVATLVAAAGSVESLRIGDGRSLPSVYRLRTAEFKAQARQLFGGNAKTQAAVDAALAWLVAHQSDDGRWDADALGAGHETKTLGEDRENAGTHADTGITALAVLALMADGHTHLRGPYRKTTQKGLEFLLASQGTDGNLAGDARLYASMYCHGMASLALSEAYAVTGDARMKTAVEKAIAYTVKSQHKTSGGWRYQPGDLGCMSQFGWQVMALKSAENAGIPIPAETRRLMEKFLQSVSHGKGGLASYRPHKQPSVTMTAEALTCRYLLNMDLTDTKIAEAVKFIGTEPPVANKPNFYCWYYGAVSMHQHGGPAWDKFNAQMQEALLSTQRTEGDFAGSWDADSQWGGYGGRAYTTAMAALSLEVYYRYLPVYQVELGGGQFIDHQARSQEQTRPTNQWKPAPRQALIPLPAVR